ncbi:nitroreductase family protein [candidate division WOR-3 bacterium]|nr:nitroreductase family protein [candidate division WOR-3 bacterium]
MDVKDAIETRRAYRSLAPVEITEDIIAELAGSAQLFCSCFNNQPWRYVFVDDDKILSRMHEALSAGNEWARAASLIIAVFSKPDLDCLIKDRRYYLFDTGMATAAMILRATELGLVAHPIAGFSPKKTREILGIPEDMEVITLVIVGKHADSISPVLSDKQIAAEKERPKRIPVTDFVYRNMYRK